MTDRTKSHLLVVGPLPPPLDGTSVSFQIFCNEAKTCLHPEQLDIVDSSPKELKDDNRRFALSDVWQAARVFVPYIRRIRSAERILIFGSNGFLLKMAPILVLAARVLGRPCYIRPFGGSLDMFCRALPSVLRKILISTLRHADGVIVQTQLLSQGLGPLIGSSVPIAPGYRALSESDLTQSTSSRETSEVRICYVGHVREEKGVLVLLESLRHLSDSGKNPVHCDLYGPIYESIDDRFRAALERTPSAQYKGVLPGDRVIPTMRTYDALVFPSYYQGEGHPGVLVEAMIAGLPIIASEFRSLPELVEHEVNGLLVDPMNVKSLVDAISKIADDQHLRKAMADKGRQMAERYDSKTVVQMILRTVGMSVASTIEPLSRQQP